MVTARRGDHQVTRNSSFFKRVNLPASHVSPPDDESVMPFNCVPPQNTQTQPPSLSPAKGTPTQDTWTGASPHPLPTALNVGPPAPPCSTVATEPVLRRSTCERKPPMNLQDYVQCVCVR